MPRRADELAPLDHVQDDLREATAHLSASELGRAAEMDPRTAQRWRAREIRLTPARLDRLARAIGCRLEARIRGLGGRKNRSPVP